MRNIVVAAALLAVVSTVFGQQPQPQLASRDQAYRLQPSDVLEVEYVFTPEYNQVAAIEPDGTVRLKVVGPVKVAGLSLDEATAAITAKASVPLNHPELTLTLKEYVKPHFTVYGEVARPGIYDIHGKVTLLQAVAMSGGVKDISKQTKVLLVRQVNAEFASVKVMNTKFLSSEKGVQEDVTLQPNDMLIVPKNLLGKIEPYVRVASQGLTSLYGVQVFK
jgi:protein involved in polysaccharide export with SLBB domain